MEERNIPTSEVTIKVPWGHIAGKAWGHSNGRPVLALHGWLDNAGSFDRLIPLLSRGLYVVAIDWPGQGLSSPRPAGELYSHINMIVDLKYVIEGLEWNKFSILAHSMGAGIAVLFAASLPEYIDRIVLLEGIGPALVKADDIPHKFGMVFKQLDAMQKRTEVVYSSLEACIERLMQANSDLTRESAAILVERGTAQVDNGFVFTRDVRAKKLSMLSYYTEEIIASYLKCIKCPVLVIMAEKSVYFPDKCITRLFVNLIYDAKLIVVPGNHHVHLNHPKRVAPAVNEHLLKDFSHSIKSQL